MFLGGGKKRKLEEKTLEVLKVAIGARKEQHDADRTGAVVPCSQLWINVGALYSKVMSLKLVLVVQVGPAKSVNYCLVEVGGGGMLHGSSTVCVESSMCYLPGYDFLYEPMEGSG